MRLGMFMMPVHPPDRTLLEHARRRHRQVAAGRSARLRRAVAGRAFLREHRADSLADDVLRQPVAAHQAHPFRHRGHQHSEPSSGDRRGRVRAVRSHEQGPLPDGRRPGRAGVRLRAVQETRSQRAQPHGDRGSRHDREDLVAGPALRSQGRVLEHLDQGRHRCQARHRLHAEALPAAAAAGVHLAGEPELVVGQDRGAERLGHDLGQHHPDLFGGVALDRVPRRLPGRRHQAARRQLARRAQPHGGAVRRGGARPRVQPRRRRTIISTPTCARCSTRSACWSS